MRVVTVICAGAIALSLFTDTGAVSSQTWRQREKDDFRRGEPAGVSLTADGTIRLSPRLDLLYETPQPYIWTVTRDGSGNVFAAGGNDGEIYRVTPDGDAGLFFRVDEPEVGALAADAGGDLYAGSSPGGRIYRIDPTGKVVWIFNTGEEYIWALTLDENGTLYAGTGIEGRIFRIDPTGKGGIHFDGSETHIRTLLWDRDGYLLAGTDGHGLVIRIDSDGQGFVLYDTPLDEVVSLAPGADGMIYAAVVGQKGKARPRHRKPAPKPTPSPKKKGESSDNGESKPQKSKPAKPAEIADAEQKVSISLEGMVLAISPDGYAREVWSGTQEAILCLAPWRDGGLLMGSSVQGRIFTLDHDGRVHEVARTISSQVTALMAAGGAAGARHGEVLVAGSNLGSVSVLHPEHRLSGTFESRVLDARSFSTWGMVTWRAEEPRGTKVVINTRSGNTEFPDSTWSEWSEDLRDQGGSRMGVPPARFLQWRAVLKTKDADSSPVLREVAVTYLQRNLPPRIGKVQVEAPGVAFQRVQGSKPGQARETKSGSAAEPDVEGVVRRSSKPKARRGFDTGSRSVTWQATDPNDDELFYDVFFRGVDERNWKPIRTRIDESFATVDSTAMPDGTYQFRVVASDAASNPVGEALTDETTSDLFDVDNTPPRVEEFRASVGDSEIRLEFVIRDSFSIVRESSYSIDAGDWIPSSPTDGLHDSLEERFDLRLPILSSGEHTIAVRARDAVGNVGAEKAIVEIP